jgi:hypothetical protein
MTYWRVSQLYAVWISLDKMLKWQPELVFYSKRAKYRDTMRHQYIYIQNIVEGGGGGGGGSSLNDFFME